MKYLALLLFAAATQVHAGPPEFTPCNKDPQFKSCTAKSIFSADGAFMGGKNAPKPVSAFDQCRESCFGECVANGAPAATPGSACGNYKDREQCGNHPDGNKIFCQWKPAGGTCVPMGRAGFDVKCKEFMSKINCESHRDNTVCAWHPYAKADAPATQPPGAPPVANPAESSPAAK